MASFSHLDPGTAEAVWLVDRRLSALPGIDGARGMPEAHPGDAGGGEAPGSITALVVVAAHPDDETLGAAGLMRAVAEAGGRVTVVIATDGERSHPASPTHSPAVLAEIRRREVAAAVAVVAPAAEIRFLGIGDGTLRQNAARLRDAVADILDSSAPDARTGTVVVAPWSGDGHADHSAAAQACAEVCAGRGITHLGYPIWLWHWGSRDDVPWADAFALPLSAEARTAKRRSIALHTSQIAPLSDAVGDEAVVHDGMRAHFDRDVEVYLREHPAESLSGDWFDEFYRRNDEDPWGFETRWYEERKRSILLASLPRHDLGRVLEVGCATGLITRQLARRANRVVALDPAEAALDVARDRLRDRSAAGVGRRGDVAFVHGQVPRDWPTGRYDTIVLSEVGYYLDAADLAETIRLIERDLSGDGFLIACHWRHPVREYPQTGDAVHAALRAVRDLEAIARHEERDFVLEVFGRAPARSVAQREGLV
ncbi:bifunctional PIG-L family deacetylase/class I SAM-dependent methyltransferase [Microbacterium rhizomatis]|uniref:Bifunctional PIG-L family deacetylase/class I SAM-dependent methyltransferase n=1 Tax=Microbacterium rhizomatis TaxID=1631477 RepID=A0A5J5IZP4_9MICO|nr:bifunctional PIG-L family deacetylase/class I SAM-dependent methyltransferase [Microbacterium rhizomatis]KAA9107705.1 bifunctional PIG-L family deacetylase/class I SAM-dependent methyltransferase [Microbacterium rhizomatis]